MTCTDAQVRLIMRERRLGRSQQQAAVKANLKDRKTVAKYERLGLGEIATFDRDFDKVPGIQRITL